jgi:hypothetical protein
MLLNQKLYKLVVYVPQTHIEQVRIAITNSGGGIIGKYDSCSFMTSGIGTYRPLKGAKPFNGEIGKLERTGEARLEITVAKNKLKKAISAMKKAHPYEEPVYDVYELAGDNP